MHHTNFFALSAVHPKVLDVLILRLRTELVWVVMLDWHCSLRTLVALRHWGEGGQPHSNFLVIFLFRPLGISLL